VVNATPLPLCPHERDTLPIVQEAEWDTGSVWTGAENLAHTGFRSLDRPAGSESLYRLIYPGCAVLFMAHSFKFCLSLQMSEINLMKAGGMFIYDTKRMLLKAEFLLTP
jgi:hypothetical protein